jgi:hypothetical protein
MKMRFLTLVAIYAISFSVSEATSNRTWSEPFLPMQTSDLHEIQGTGDYIWFISEGGAGRFNVISGDFIFFDQSHFDKDREWDDYKITVGDSNHAAIYYYDDPHQVWVYDGKSWKKIEAAVPCDGMGGFSFDKEGKLWCMYDFDDDPNELYFHDGIKWQTLQFDTITTGISGYQVDDSGIVWFSSDDTPKPILYRYNTINKELTNYLSLDFNNIVKDPHGKIFLIGDSVFYSVSENFKMTKLPKYSNEYIPNPSIDSDGNLWCKLPNVPQNSSPGRLAKFDLHNPQSTWIGDSSKFYEKVCFNKRGVYETYRGGLHFFRNNDTNFEDISFDSIRCENCGAPSSEILFRKDGSLVYVLLSSKSTEMIVQQKEGLCKRIPLPDGCRLDAIAEKNDGTLIACLSSPVRGLYQFDGSTWELLPGTQNIFFSNIFVDKKGKIWSILDTKIIHQTDFGWELIDHNNSNLPSFGQSGGSYDVSVKEDSDGAIWAVIDSSVVKTFDGYNWTVFNKNNSKLQNINRRGLYINQSGNIQTLFSFDDGINSTKIKRSTFANNDWHIETIELPGDFYSNISFEQDSWGTIYASSSNWPTKGPLYCYNSSDSSWTPLDSTTTPYNVWYFMGDDGSGNLYFKDIWDKTIVSNHSATPTLPKKTTAYVKSSLVAKAISTGAVSVYYNLPESDKMSLSVYSLDGRLVRTLFNGFQKKGGFQRTFNSGLPHGVYLLHLRTSDNLLVTRVLLR